MLQERSWTKIRFLGHAMEGSYNERTHLLSLTGSYAMARMNRAVVTTFAVIILAIDFGQDEESGGTSEIDYLLTTSLYFVISELKFSKSEDHVIIR